MKINEDILKVAEDLKKNLNTMLELNKQAITAIPDEYATKKNEILNDLSDVPKHVERADFGSINALLNKYANNNP
jgi:hypothetical protein